MFQKAMVLGLPIWLLERKKEKVYTHEVINMNHASNIRKGVCSSGYLLGFGRKKD
jgi:hypothetical protein